MDVRCREESANLKEPQVERELGPRVGMKDVGGVPYLERAGQGHSELEIIGVGWNEVVEGSIGRAVGGQERPLMGEGIKEEGRAESGVKTCPQQAVSSRAVWVDRVRPVPTWKGCQNGQDFVRWRTTYCGRSRERGLPRKG